MHAKATAYGQVIAETDKYEVVDGNIYFPPDSIKGSPFTQTSKSTHCPYKGDASYYTISAGKTELKDAAWYYPNPKPGMEKIKDHVAFYKTQVQVESE